MNFDLHEELEKAEAEATDLLWRRWLVDGWRKYPNSSISLCVVKFVQRYGTLKARPKSMPDDNPREKHMHITRYLACFYKPVSDGLLDGWSEEQAVRALGKLKKRTSGTELRKITADSKIKRETRQLLGSAKLTSRAVDDKFATHRRSEQWGMCK